MVTTGWRLVQIAVAEALPSNTSAVASGGLGGLCFESVMGRQAVSVASWRCPFQPCVTQLAQFGTASRAGLPTGVSTGLIMPKGGGDHGQTAPRSDQAPRATGGCHPRISWPRSSSMAKVRTVPAEPLQWPSPDPRSIGRGAAPDRPANLRTKPTR